mmetsp:Transcript_20648/g.48885  ORF Transcript_20648/g.48885 Transcript_20648/m.48885 type:complete len:242 (-) Transcript_20648:968-1693(-)
MRRERLPSSSLELCATLSVVSRQSADTSARLRACADLDPSARPSTSVRRAGALPAASNSPANCADASPASPSKTKEHMSGLGRCACSAPMAESGRVLTASIAFAPSLPQRLPTLNRSSGAPRSAQLASASAAPFPVSVPRSSTRASAKCAGGSVREMELMACRSAATGASANCALSERSRARRVARRSARALPSKPPHDTNAARSLLSSSFTTSCTLSELVANSSTGRPGEPSRERDCVLV